MVVAACFRRALCTAAIGASAMSNAAAAVKCKMQSVRIACSGNVADDLVEALLCFGANSCSIENANRNGNEPMDDGPVPWDAAPRKLWNQSCITALFPPGDDVAESIAFAADSVGISEVPEYEVGDVQDCDWVQQVKDSFHPVEILADFWIVPQWCDPPNPQALNIFLDPGVAFGTGEHPTTRLCLRWLHKTIKGKERILDYGTGSGVLAIAALKMGASEAVGVDIDPMALSSATSNATLNNLELNKFPVFVVTGAEEDLMSKEAVFDIVIANILLNPLISLSSRISNYARPGGTIALSGIILEQVPQVVEKYSSVLKDIKIDEDEGWACVSGTRR